ncbi:unnamed protein product [Discula destructiva]
MLSNRRSVLGPISNSNGTHQDNVGRSRVSVCNPKPAWRRASSFHGNNNNNNNSSSNNNNNSNAVPRASSYYEAAPPIYNAKSEQPHCSTPSVLTSTAPEVPGFTVRRTIGTVYGTTTGALPKDGVKLWIKSVCGMGAEVRNLTNLIYTMREAAMERMALDCVSRGGNAIVGLSFTESEIMGCIAVSVQGTAVYVEVKQKGVQIQEENPFDS